LASALKTGVTFIYQALFPNAGTTPLFNDELNSEVRVYAGVGLGGGCWGSAPSKMTCGFLIND